MTTQLKYGNTRSFLVRGSDGWLLVDTDYAGTLPAFYRAIKQCGIRVTEIRYVLATHYHPDHVGLVGALMRKGVGLILVDVQREFVHFSDGIFERDGVPYVPIEDAAATVVSCGESREFLSRMGISGEIIHTPSHSADSISLVLDDGDCLVGDLDPFGYLEAYADSGALRRDWERLFSLRPKRILHAHMPEAPAARQGPV